MIKVFGFISIFAATALGAHLTLSYYRFLHAPTAERLQQLWERDLRTLESEAFLPPEWKQISEIVYITPTKHSKKWVKQIKAPIKLNTKGPYIVEILITDWESNNQVHAVIQYDLIHKESGNVVWEFGRTFSLGPSS